MSTALYIERRGTAGRRNAVHDLLQQVREVVHVLLRVVDVRALRHGQRALHRELPLLRVSIERAAEVLSLHKPLPHRDIIVVRKPHRTVGVSLWQQVFPVEGSHAVSSQPFIKDAQITALCPDRRECIVGVILLRDERMCAAQQLHLRPRTPADMQRVRRSCPQAHKYDFVVLRHLAFRLFTIPAKCPPGFTNKKNGRRKPPSAPFARQYRPLCRNTIAA